LHRLILLEKHNDPENNQLAERNEMWQSKSTTPHPNQIESTQHIYQKTAQY